MMQWMQFECRRGVDIHISEVKLKSFSHLNKWEHISILIYSVHKCTWCFTSEAYFTCASKSALDSKLYSGASQGVSLDQSPLCFGPRVSQRSPLCVFFLSSKAQLGCLRWQSPVWGLGILGADPWLWELPLPLGQKTFWAYCMTCVAISFCFVFSEETE